MKRDRKVKFVHSIAFKFVLLTLIGVFFTATIMLLMSGVNAKNTAKNISSDYALSMAKISAQSIDDMEGEELTAQQYAEMLSSVKLEGAESSYAYLVDGNNGNMIYHPVPEKIGQSVENEIIKGVVQDVSAGKTVEPSIAVYKFKGAIKYAAYAVTNANQIVVVTVDESEILKPIHSMTYKAIAVAVIIVIVLAAACIALSMVICKPIHALTDLLNEMSELNFGQNEILTKLGARKDETGAMARAMHIMRQNLRTMIQEIVGISNQTKSDVNGLTEISNKISRMCEDNSATSEQLAAGMQETSATTMGINEHVSIIKTGADQISNTAFEGAQMSDEVMERATSLKDKTVSASQNTLQIYNEVKDKAENAINGAKEVEQINALISLIMDISSQTNLLALNASIEAARAGEAGKGFAVVATEIGALANQTSDTVKDIGNVVEGVNAAVGNMIQCLKHTLDFLDNTVLVEYKDFEDVSAQYQQDAGAFKDSMAKIRDKTVELADAIENIVSAVEGINTTVEESAAGVTNVAQKTSSMVEKTNEAHEMASECYECADKLRTLMDKFTLA